MRGPIVVAAALATLGAAADTLDVTQYGVVYRAPGTERVSVQRDLPYVAGGKTLHFDLYRDLHRPGRAHGPLPVIVFVNGVGGRLEDWEIYRSWGRLMAARGYAAVVAESDPAAPAASVAALVAKVGDSAKTLGVDAQRIGIWACSANVTVAVPLLMDAAPAGVRAAVLYYGSGTARAIRGDLPVLHVLAGRDGPQLIAGERALRAAAEAAHAPWTMVEEASLPHAFDALDTSPVSLRTIALTLAFFDANLLPLPSPPPPSTERTVVWHMYANEPAEAARTLEALVAAHPRDGAAWSLLGAARRNLGQRAEAETAYRKVLELEPGDAGALRWLAVLPLQGGDCAGAKPWLDALAKKGPLDGFVLGERGKCLLVAKQYDEAAASFREALARAPNAVVSYNLACAETLAGHPDAAFAALDQALERGFTDRRQLTTDTDLAALRGDPRFAALLAKLPAP